MPTNQFFFRFSKLLYLRLTFQATHAGPYSAARRIGDLGNIATDSFGRTAVNILDTVVRLDGSGVADVVGRTLVVFAGEDDFGSRQTPESKVDGSAGPIIACGRIITVPLAKTLRTY